MDEFDYLVIGGGSSGCVVAGRLSEDPSTSVALLEAGGMGDSWVITMPAAGVLTVPTRLHNWAFKPARPMAARPAFPRMAWAQPVRRATPPTRIPATTT